MAQKGCFWPFWTLLGALWHTRMALPDPQNGSNATPGMCPDLFHPCSTLGMTVACIVKAVLMSTKLNKMVETGIGSPEWAENIIKKVMVVMMMNNVH